MTDIFHLIESGLEACLGRRELLRRALAVGALAMPAYATAQSDYPSKPIRIVVPVAPGFATDYLARLIAENLRVKMNATFVVENRASGAAGNVGSEYAARAQPDGYTLLFASPGPLSINKFLYPKLGFDPADFVPISLVASAQNVLVVRANSPFKTLGEIIEHAKARPGALSYASGGAGTTQHLAVEMLKSQAGLDILHIPYKGSAAAMSGFIQGQADFFVAELGNSMPFIRDGRVRAIAIGSVKRVSSLPDVPTMAETLPSFTTSAWYGLVAPPKTPPAIAVKLSAAIAEVMKQSDVEAKLQGMSILPIGSTPAEMAKFIQEESVRWGKLIRSAKIAVD
ncbi:Bug family tripartite tricarboxylate transporter substrate binding protein [Variovorax sp. HJSM1_2]|uniref:Bug family tripartite tricarboxylate transporter substrate binding protein n=1 Tax=Variovorax sp. HJSM1_2 TaxID=3366263 RepID=UPI003BDE442B